MPTPVDIFNKPDLTPLISASKMVGKVMPAGCVIAFESTVYPGVTEDVCGAEIEKISGKKWKKDFYLGYSPERVNPGDREHTIDKIVKVVAGDSPETLAVLAHVYGAVTKAGIHCASSIKVAEAAKVLRIPSEISISLLSTSLPSYLKKRVLIHWRCSKPRALSGTSLIFVPA